MKILCICAGGNCRSQAMAYLLKYGHDIDAMAIGYERNSPSTIAMMAEWADLIFVMTPVAAEHIPDAYAAKCRNCNVGQDIWWLKGPPATLLNACEAHVRTHFSEGT